MSDTKVELREILFEKMVDKNFDGGQMHWLLIKYALDMTPVVDRSGIHYYTIGGIQEYKSAIAEVDHTNYK